MTDKTTYEEFIELSKNPPVWEGETLYKLSVVSSFNYKRRYPKYCVSTLSLGFFYTREEAEQAMHQHKEEKDTYGFKKYCYYLHEYPCSQIINVSDFVTCRVYDADGQLIEQTLCSYSCYIDTDCNKFFGRAEEKLRFKKGDIVEVLHKDEVNLAIIVSFPASPERAWRFHCGMKEEYRTFLLKKHIEQGGTEENFIFDDNQRQFFMDYSDDSYTVIDGPSYDSDEHVEAIHIFAPHFTIPTKMRQRFERYYNEYLKECEEYEKKS